MSSWASQIYTWWYGPNKPTRSSEAAHDPALRGHFRTLLDNTEPPATFKASDVAQLLTKSQLAKLGYADWREAMPAVIEMAFELRELGYCDILQRGNLVPADVDYFEIEGPIRIRRRVEKISALEEDDW